MVIAEVRCRGMILNLLRAPRGDNFEVIGRSARLSARALQGDHALHDGERRAYLPSWPGATFSPGPFWAGGPIKRSLRVTI
jgi:hypothetical protein